MKEPEEEAKQAVERGLQLRTFENEEMESRVERAREACAPQELDALVCSDEANVVYFTGIETPSFATRSRPILVIIPAASRPILVCSRSQGANARAASWIQDIRTFEGFESEAVHALSASLRDLGLSRGRIGLELGAELRLGMSVSGFRQLEAALPDATLCDAARCIRAVRAIKSSAEIALLRQAGKVNAQAFDAAIEAIGPGSTERDVGRSWSTALLEYGADRAGYLAAHSGPGNYRRVSGCPTDRALCPGDLLWMDGGAVYGGYWSDITRLVAIGTPRDEDCRRYEFSWSVIRELISAIRPAMSAGDIARRSLAIFRDAGLTMAQSSRIGHGLGRELTEPPSIVDGDETTLEPGMVISLETGVAAWDGYFVIEDNVVVTSDGSEMLSVPALPYLPVAEIAS
jgi:Xaa-Pro aminopeptidase